MKTLIISLEYPPQVGGIASYVYEQASVLKPEDTYVLAPPFKDSSEFDSANTWTTIRNSFYYSFFWPRWLRLLWASSGVIKKYKIERVFVHHCLPVGYVALFLKRFLKIKYWVFFHGTDVALAARKSKKLLAVCKGADGLIVNSDYLKNKLISIIGTGFNIKIVRPCPGNEFFTDIDADVLKKMRAELGLEGKKVIFTAARISEGKGFFKLVQVLPLLLDKIPNLVWLVVGSGSKEAKLIDYINKAGLGGVVRLVGEVPYKDLPKYYRLANVFVMLSHPDNLVNESWGGVFIEAGAAGVPVVAGKAGGVEEAVVDGVSGLVVDSANDEMVINALERILTDKALATTLGAGGKKIAEELYKSKPVEY